MAGRTVVLTFWHRPLHAMAGELDLRGTLAVDKAAPVGFTDIRLGQRPARAHR